MKVLVCGGRNYSDMEGLHRVLNALNMLKPPITLLIHGCALGADSMAGTWAKHKGIPVQEFPADWKKHGRSAGPKRNLQMLADGKPDLVVAFPGGRGTAHMVEAARKSGVKVITVTGDSTTDIGE